MYSSTVLVEMVVVVFEVSFCWTYVADVEIVLHALQLVAMMPTAPIAMMIKIFLIFDFFNLL